jgi:AraC family transcriptional regulator
MNKNVLKSTFYLLNIDYVQLNKSWNYRNVISPFYRLYYIERGEGKLSNPANSLVLESGYLYLVPSFTLCHYSCDGFLDQYYLHFIEESSDGHSLFLLNRKILKIPATQTDVENFRRLLMLNPGRGLKNLSHNPEVYEKRPIIQSFQELNDVLPVSAYVETQGIILQLLSHFLTTEHVRLKENSAIPSKILEAVNYIQTNLQQNLTVAHLAARANLNPDYFSRIFQAHTGERPLVYLQFKRIERAQFLIITTDLPLSEVAAETGFESISYFSRIFKRLTGQTPGQYRVSHKIV